MLLEINEDDVIVNSFYPDLNYFSKNRVVSVNGFVQRLLQKNGFNFPDIKTQIVASIHPDSPEYFRDLYIERALAEVKVLYAHFVYIVDLIKKNPEQSPLTFPYKELGLTPSFIMHIHHNYYQSKPQDPAIHSPGYSNSV